jgi:hypothetical protein
VNRRAAYAPFTSRPVVSGPMLDIVYVAVTVGFFALMLAFVRGLEILGRGATGEERES